MSPRTGRPTNNPKSESVNVRLDAECEEILTEYCKRENITKAAAIRVGIKKLKPEIKKQKQLVDLAKDSYLYESKDFSFCKYCNTDRGFFQVRKI